MSSYHTSVTGLTILLAVWVRHGSWSARSFPEWCWRLELSSASGCLVLFITYLRGYVSKAIYLAGKGECPNLEHLTVIRPPSLAALGYGRLSLRLTMWFAHVGCRYGPRLPVFGVTTTFSVISWRVVSDGSVLRAFATGSAILTLGAWPKGNMGAARGLQIHLLRLLARHLRRPVIWTRRILVLRSSSSS